MKDNLEIEKYIEQKNDKNLPWQIRQQAVRQIGYINEEKILDSSEKIEIVENELLLNDEVIYQYYSKRNLENFQFVIIFFLLIETLFYFTIIKLEGFTRSGWNNLNIGLVVIIVGLVVFIMAYNTIDDFEGGIKVFRVIAIPLIIVLSLQNIYVKSGIFMKFTNLFNWLHYTILAVFALVIGVLYRPFIKSKEKYLYEKHFENEKEEIENHFKNSKKELLFYRIIHWIGKLLIRSKINFIQKISRYFGNKKNIKIKIRFIFLVLLVVVTPILGLNFGYFENNKKDEKGEMHISFFNFPNSYWFQNNTKIRAYNVEYQFTIYHARCRIFYINLTHINANETLYYKDYSSNPKILIDASNYFLTDFLYTYNKVNYNKQFEDFNWSDTISFQIKYNEAKWINITYQIGLDIVP